MLFSFASIEKKPAIAKITAAKLITWRGWRGVSAKTLLGPKKLSACSFEKMRLVIPRSGEK
jgi:hypothetical protein